MQNKVIKIGITHGDINGIGYEIITKTLLDHRIFDLCTPIIYGSPKVASYHRKALDIDNFSLNIIKAPEEANPKRANIINVTDDEIRVELGKSTAVAGEASRDALLRASDDLKKGKIQALLTAPVNKRNMQSEDFNYAGFLRSRGSADADGRRCDEDRRRNRTHTVFRSASTPKPGRDPV